MKTPSGSGAVPGFPQVPKRTQKGSNLLQVCCPSVRKPQTTKPHAKQTSLHAPKLNTRTLTPHHKWAYRGFGPGQTQCRFGRKPGRQETARKPASPRGLRFCDIFMMRSATGSNAGDGSNHTIPRQPAKRSCGAARPTHHRGRGRAWGTPPLERRTPFFGAGPWWARPPGWTAYTPCTLFSWFVCLFVIRLVG